MVNIANSDIDYYTELKFYYDPTYARNAMNDYGINLCLVNGVEYDNTIWFDKKKAIDFFDRLCFRLMNVNKGFIGRGDGYNKQLVAHMRHLWKVMLMITNTDLHMKEIKLSNEDLFENTRRYYVDKKEKIVKYVHDHIEETFDYLKNYYNLNVYETLFKYLYPKIYDNACNAYGNYEVRGKMYLEWLREYLAINYSSLLGNHEYPIHDILNDSDAIRVYPIVYSKRYGLVYIHSDYRLGIENKKYWKISQQQTEVMKLQIDYFLSYVLKQQVDQIFILLNVSSFGFQCKIDKLTDLEINKDQLLQILEELDVAL